MNSPLHEWGLLESVPSPLNTPQIQIIKDWKALLLFFFFFVLRSPLVICQAWSCTSCACDLSAGDLASACYCVLRLLPFYLATVLSQDGALFLLFLCTVQHWWALGGTQREEEVPCFRGALEGTRCIWKTLRLGKKAAENQLNLIFTQHRELVKKNFERRFHKIFMANNKTALHVLKVCLAEMFIVLADVKNMNERMQYLYTHQFVYTQHSVLKIVYIYNIYIYIYNIFIIIKQGNICNKIILENRIYFQNWNAILKILLSHFIVLFKPFFKGPLTVIWSSDPKHYVYIVIFTCWWVSVQISFQIFL